MSKKYIKLIIVTSILSTIMSLVTYRLNAEEANDDLGLTLGSYLRYMPSCEIKAGSGRIKIIEAGAESGYKFKAFDRLPVKFSVGNRYIGIENTTSTELPAHLTEVVTDFETTLPLFDVENTYFRLGISPSFFGDNWQFNPSNFRIPFRLVFINLFNEQWTFLAGLTVYPDFEKEIWPVVGFIYKPNDKITFSITPKRPNVSYLLNEKTLLFIEGGGSVSEYEVAKDNLEDVVLKYKELHLGTGIKYRINEYLQASVTAGCIFDRYLKYRDSLGKVSVKNGAYTELRLESKF